MNIAKYFEICQATVIIKTYLQMSAQKEKKIMSNTINLANVTDSIIQQNSHFLFIVFIVLGIVVVIFGISALVQIIFSSGRHPKIIQIAYATNIISLLLFAIIGLIASAIDCNATSKSKVRIAQEIQAQTGYILDDADQKDVLLESLYNKKNCSGTIAVKDKDSKAYTLEYSAGYPLTLPATTDYQMLYKIKSDSK